MNETKLRRDGIELYLNEIGRIPLLTRAEEVRLSKRVQRGDRSARQQMIQANLRLVVRIAKDYQGMGLPLLDLVNEGNIGLMKAVEHFRHDKGAKFSTYAAWWIKQSVRRALSNQSRTVRLPIHIADRVSKLNRASFALTEELGRDPTDEELAEKLGVERDRVNQLRSVSTAPLSLDASLNEGDGDSAAFGDIISDDNAATPAEILAGKSLITEMQSLMVELDDREAEIITKRFGLDGKPPRTLEEVSRKFKVSRERIRQIQEVALQKLRRAWLRQESTGEFSLS